MHTALSTGSALAAGLAMGAAYTLFVLACMLLSYYKVDFAPVMIFLMWAGWPLCLGAAFTFGYCSCVPPYPSAFLAVLGALGAYTLGNAIFAVILIRFVLGGITV